MSPTFNPQDTAVNRWFRDYVVVLRTTVDYRKGDIVVLKDPRSDKRIVKRLVAQGNEFVRKDGAVHYVPPGHWWVEGDNPENSIDSRTFNAVHQGLLDALVIAVVWPFWRSRWLEIAMEEDEPNAEALFEKLELEQAQPEAPQPSKKDEEDELVEDLRKLVATGDAAREPAQGISAEAAPATSSDAGKGDEQGDERRETEEATSVASVEAAPAQQQLQVQAPSSLGIPELTSLAEQLGCTEAAILEAAAIHPSVLAELPADVRGPLVMQQVSQVDLEHLRTTPAPTAAAPSEVAKAALERVE